MNRNKLVFIAIAVFVLIVLFFTSLFWKPQQSPNEESRAIPQHKAERPPVHKDLVDKRIALIGEMAKSDPNYKWKIPLDFYGKVVDQHNQAVPNAKVEIHYIPDPNGERWYKLATSADGTFTYGGVAGQFLYVRIGAPDGYGTVDTTCSADYNYAVPGEFNFHVPDPKRPVVFKVWKYVGPEPMRRLVFFREKSFKRDGTVQWYDLGKGVSTSGQLGLSAVEMTKTTDSQMRIRLRIFAGNGCGILETADVPPFTAPQSGYGREISHEYGFMDGSYFGTMNFKFYLITSNSRYAAVEAKLEPIVGMIEPTITIWLNPSGSRNLEYVESLSIQDGKDGH